MHNLKPKKRLGQHFLHSKTIAQKIVGLLDANETQTVAEIGPGKGILSQFLFEKYPKLWLIEVDPEAVEFLYANFPNQNLQIIHEDVLKVNFNEFLENDASLIGNLPYNISSPIFFQMLEYRALFKEGVFMIQKEVAQRICANHGNKTYGILSVLIGCFYERKYAFSVSPGAFFPPPKVISGVIKLKRKENIPNINFNKFKHLVKSAFAKRRKTLRNALKGFSIRDFPEKKELLSKRAEQLSIEQFVQLLTFIE